VAAARPQLVNFSHEPCLFLFFLNRHHDAIFQPAQASKYVTDLLQYITLHYSF